MAGSPKGVYPPCLIPYGFQTTLKNRINKPVGAISQKALFERAVSKLAKDGQKDKLEDLADTMADKACDGDVPAASLVLNALYPKGEESGTNTNIKNEIIAFLYKEVAPEKVTELLEHLDKKYPDDK